MKKIINDYANYTVAFYGPADLVVKKANINKARFSPSLIVEDGPIKKSLGIFESSILDLLKKYFQPLQ